MERCDKAIAKSQENIAKFQKDIANQQQRKNEYSNKIISEQNRLAKQSQRKTEQLNRQQSTLMDNLTMTVKNHDYEIKKLKELPKKIIVLFLASNPRDQEQLSLDIEVRGIEEQISKARHRESIVLESRWAVRSGDILQHINTCEPTIVHFSGHGSDNDELVLMDKNDQTKLISLEAIVQAMSVANENLRLVFFNTCFSYNQAALVTEHVDCAIGMSKSITDEAAQYFSAQFYSSLSFGLSVKKSFDQAKAALLLEGIDEVDTPQLFVKDSLVPEEIFLLASE
ncbi:CHAT domain-containing protein [Acinetobacter sp. WCHAc010052]|uniref:CHAT domain-containing protein n=1 Tax=Acinetobacter sp. WCHAc010052 TaxID=2004647 RepID=UPI001D17F7E1|nr:CHAT domain-containing protein [Acinetobacter sp. WCHAc010052]